MDVGLTVGTGTARRGYASGRSGGRYRSMQPTLGRRAVPPAHYVLLDLFIKFYRGFLGYLGIDCVIVLVRGIMVSWYVVSWYVFCHV